ncbi:MAG: hypothetical protein ABSC94_15890 [Polyangiaceae bacterium]|jgi:hypothetical protein
MVDPVGELKIRAEILHRRIALGDAQARGRLRTLPEFSRANDEALAAASHRMRRKHCLLVVAREHGFDTWEHARGVLRGDAGETDFGSLLYGKCGAGHLNAWFVRRDEARSYLAEVRRNDPRRYLLPYRRHFFVADGYFVQALGLDPDDGDWEAIGFDWTCPQDATARKRLYQKRLEALREEP